jgi:hypothetical protein
MRRRFLKLVQASVVFFLGWGNSLLCAYGRRLNQNKSFAFFPVDCSMPAGARAVM